MSSYGGTTIHATLADLDVGYDGKSDESKEARVSLMDAEITGPNALKLLKKFETNVHPIITHNAVLAAIFG